MPGSVCSKRCGSGIHKRATCHSFQHSFITHLLEDGYDIRTVHELLGHRSVKTAMIYMHVLEQRPLEVRSPLDRLADTASPQEFRPGV